MSEFTGTIASNDEVIGFNGQFVARGRSVYISHAQIARSGEGDVKSKDVVGRCGVDEQVVLIGGEELGEVCFGKPQLVYQAIRNGWQFYLSHHRASVDHDIGELAESHLVLFGEVVGNDADAAYFVQVDNSLPVGSGHQLLQRV